MIKPKDNYLKIVEWSKEDDCYIGTAPGLIIGGVHGKSEKVVFKKLCRAVDEALDLLKKEGKPIPENAIKCQYSGKIALRIDPELHRKLAIRSVQTGESINKLIEESIRSNN